MKLEMNEDSANDTFIVLRPMNCELNLLTRSDGSAILSQGLYIYTFFYIFNINL